MLRDLKLFFCFKRISLDPTRHTLELITLNRNAFWCCILQQRLCGCRQVGRCAGPVIGAELIASSELALFLLPANKSANHTESQNGPGWKGPQGSLNLQPPCRMQGHQPPRLIPAQAAQGPIQPGLEHLQGWGIHSLSGPLLSPRLVCCYISTVEVLGEQWSFGLLWDTVIGL